MGIISSQCCCETDGTTVGLRRPSFYPDRCQEETIETPEAEVATVRWTPLEMTIVGATGLRNADFSINPFKRDLSDPYCICEIPGKPLSRTVTEVVDNDLNPVWNHKVQFADFDVGDSFKFRIFDKDVSFKRDDFLGHATLDSAEFHPHGFDQDVLLSDAGKNRKAYLRICIAPAVQVEAPVVKQQRVALPKKPLSKYREARPSGNTNLPSSYVWLRDALRNLASNSSPCEAMRRESTVTRARSDKSGSAGDEKSRSICPLLFVIGGCPNAMCGMQAVMFSVDGHKIVDFWWVKPSKSNPNELEQETLSRHEKGTHKNAPGRSGPFYQPLADLFQQGVRVRDWKFGLETISQDEDGIEVVRAFIQNEVEKDNRLYILAMWQEDFPLNPFARSKYIKGKLVYQRSFKTEEYFSRQYEIIDGVSNIFDIEEGPVSNVLPGDAIKTLWELDTG